MASSESTVISPETVSKAVASLLKWRKSQPESEKPPNILGEGEEFVYLVLTLKKIPPKGRVNPHKLPLPHTLHSTFSEHCLILDDRPNKAHITKPDAQTKIKSESIPIAKVLKLSKLASDYRAFEQKRKLCDSYDLFFTDKAVVPILPRLLGKQFFKKRKVPVPLDLKKKNWKEQVDKALASAMMFLRTGTCSVVKVAKVGMEESEIAENVVAAVKGAVELVPKKWANVRSLHVKLLESLSLPIYQAVPDVRLKIEGVKAAAEKAEEKEKEDGNPEKAKKKNKNKKGRIHQVKYMDEDGVVSGSEVEEDGGNAAIGDDDEIGNGGVEKIVSKKRKKGSKVGKEAAKLTSVKTLGESETPKDGAKRRRVKDATVSAKVTKEGLVKKVGDKLQAKEEGSKEGKKKKLKGADVKVKAKKTKKIA